MRVLDSYNHQTSATFVQLSTFGPAFFIVRRRSMDSWIRESQKLTTAS